MDAQMQAHLEEKAYSSSSLLEKPSVIFPSKPCWWKLNNPYSTVFSHQYLIFVIYVEFDDWNWCIVNEFNLYDYDIVKVYKLGSQYQ